jgi:hypothetical protein
MVEKEIEFRKKRELSEIISDSFLFIKQEYKPISKLIFTYVLPFLILYGIVQVYFQMKVLGNIDLSNPESMMANIGPIYLNLFLFSLFGIFVQSLLIGAFYSYLEIYIKKGKGNFELSEITPLLFSNGLLALSASLVLFIVVIFGMFIFIIPGIYFANTFSLVIIIFMFEKKGLGNAFSRSWILVKSQWWNTFLLNIIGVIIIWAMSFVLSLPSLIIGVGTNVLNSIESGPVEQPQSYWILIGLTTIISSLFWIIPYTFLAMHYFNLDERTKPRNSIQNNIE